MDVLECLIMMFLKYHLELQLVLGFLFINDLLITPSLLHSLGQM
jgi:hypothetical protein